MRVNVVVIPPDLNWIGGRLARELCTRIKQYDIDAVINRGDSFDVEYQQFVYGAPIHRPSVGVFTHGQHRPMVYGPHYDGAIAFNSVMVNYLRSAGVKNARLIELPVDDRFIKRPIVFGVAGRTYADGRKGEHLVAEMVKAGYTVRAWGHGWPCSIVSDRVEDLVPFYRGLDYYVDTSSDEGGCVPALECLALGVPVISHTVGVDRPVLAYQTHSWASLSALLHKLTHPPTYDDWTLQHALYFKELFG